MQKDVTKKLLAKMQDIFKKRQQQLSHSSQHRDGDQSQPPLSPDPNSPAISSISPGTHPLPNAPNLLHLPISEVSYVTSLLKELDTTIQSQECWDRAESLLTLYVQTLLKLINTSKENSVSGGKDKKKRPSKGGEDDGDRTDSDEEKSSGTATTPGIGSESTSSPHVFESSFLENALKEIQLKGLELDMINHLAEYARRVLTLSDKLYPATHPQTQSPSFLPVADSVSVISPGSLPSSAKPRSTHSSARSKSQSQKSKRSTSQSKERGNDEPKVKEEPRKDKHRDKEKSKEQNSGGAGSTNKSKSNRPTAKNNGNPKKDTKKRKTTKR